MEFSFSKAKWENLVWKIFELAKLWEESNSLLNLTDLIFENSLILRKEEIKKQRWTNCTLANKNEHWKKFFMLRYRCVVHTVYLLVFLNGGTLDLRYNHSFRFCFTFFLATESFCLKGQNGSLRENNCSLNVEASFWSVFCFLVLLSGEKAKNSQQTKLATNWNSRRDFSDCLEKVSFYIMLSNFVGI